ncbi:SCO6745 family protein [Nocardia puris]|uniref:EvbL n=1 Tax=Nocardia puris TaxID=208602 RepID=A0A366DHI6_9NOCA|nr:hypothetical protein [Nocardia puris]RBO89456.1 hypothetical protein DFR74_107134 [Nocardia puris]
MSVATAVKDQIQQLGGAFMFSREAKAFGQACGADAFLGPYVRGRGGVLGEVDADVVTAAFGFFPGDTIRPAWESVSMPAADAAVGYMEACREFGRRKLADFADARQLADLLEKVAAAAEPAGVPLFAGWRALPLPEDGPARLSQLTHVLRELRGGLHLIGVLAAGLTPLQAVLISGSPIKTGPQQAGFYGYPEPYEEVTADHRARWEQAEAITDALIAPAFAALTPSEATTLTDLLPKAHAIGLSR